MPSPQQHSAELALVSGHARRGAALLRAPHRGPFDPQQRRAPLGLGRLISPRLLESKVLLGVAGARPDWCCTQSPEGFFVQEILPHALDNQLVVDVGANVGQFSVEVARRGRGLRGICFEPLPAACAKLHSNLLDAIGPAYGRQVEVHCAAIGARDGTLELPAAARARSASSNQSSYSARSASFVLNPNSSAFSGGVSAAAKGTTSTVPITTLDTVLATSGEEVLLLKSDTQGFETDVLRGAARLLATSRVRLVLLEASNLLMRRAGSSPLQLMRLLDAMGYACTHLAFWAQLRDVDGRVKFKPLNVSHVPQLLRGRLSLPFEEVAAWLARLPPLNTSGWTDLLCW